MENDQKKWMEEVLGSMQGSRRAQPKANLFAQIESKLDTPTIEIIPLHQWRMVAASAVLLVVLNFYAAYEFKQQQPTQNNELPAEDMYNYQVITDFKIYE